MLLLHPLLIVFPCLCVLSSHSVSGTEDTKTKVLPSAMKQAISKAKVGMKFSKGTFETVDTHSFEDLGITPPPTDSNDTILEDHHTYYNSTSMFGQEAAKAYWVDLDKMPQEQVVNHAMLSDSHRQATTVMLSFDFPFYGNRIRNITIATGGFLYTGDYLHSWIAATQYVAPLMANFDTRLSDQSNIKYADNGTAFIVQWDKVHVLGRIDDGTFTFQVTLLNNGHIIFAYKDIPYPVLNISDAEHPVKIGISDAYIIERKMLFIRRKTIYEYHKIDLLKKDITNNSAIYFTALPTCLDHHTCQECVDSEVSGCTWCDAAQRCSDGIDRQRQNWLVNACTSPEAHGGTCTGTGNETISIGNTFPTVSVPPYVSVSTRQRGSATSSTSEVSSVSVASVYNNVTATVNSSSSQSVNNQSIRAAYSQEEIKTEKESPESVNPAVVVAVVFILAAVGSLGLWIFYAYKNPHTSSGQFLIKYRPSQWKANKDDISNTSPSLHM